MLDNETKRRIDTARDILVGKVPDPKSQVEQITIALIYKFMDDMDAEAEELGGKRKFFSGEFERYGWKKLMAPDLGGFDVLNLYAEAIQKMNINPNIPQLFRDIFKNAYLPYRDPETLKSFLKVIDDFEYDHSERLGDAFEYLLSVLGSQGEAGQFRTPRHIIDFMVDVIDPKKDNTILDPACGTAGFLISSYKHILKHNSSNFIPDKDKEAYEQTDVSIAELTSGGTIKYKGDKLTPDERAKLSKNIKGYDISPDMVRLSLVNLYLHGFTDPKIQEYDTLTSEDNWNEYADIILANPPFMSPKGGIKPHKRFSIQSNRSEVLFVDYMVEHLTPNGKAAIIVPEGIIFQSGIAYKQLRKMLIENYLFAVVSLPAGVFNPYSGVKTSILLIDKTLNKKTDKILFVKIENDGFDLGAQRRPKPGSQLPTSASLVKEYIQCCHSGLDAESTLTDKFGPNNLWNIATKEKIGENGDWNLSAERYKSNRVVSSIFKWVKLNSVVDFMQDGNWIESKDQSSSGIRLIQTGNVGMGEYLDKPDKAKFISEETFERLNCTEVFPNDVLVSRLPDPVGRACIVPELRNKMITAVDCTIIRFNQAVMLPNLFVYYTLTENYYKQLTPFLTGSSRERISRKNLEQITFPVPPIEIQKEIVAEIEGWQKIIDGARQVVENYKPHIDIHPEWPKYKLEDICEIKSGGTPSRDKQEYWGGDIPWVGSTVCKDEKVYNAEEYITELGLQKSSAKLLPSQTTLIALVGATIGKTAFLEFDCSTNQNIAGLIPKDVQQLHPEYLFYASQHLYHEFMKLGEGKFRMANLSFIKTLEIPIPNLITQTEIVNRIKKELRAIDANKELISIFEQKIKDKIAKVWGE